MMALFGIGKTPDIEQLTLNHDVRGLIKALQLRNDPVIRKRAAEVLIKFEDPLAVIPLINALDDDDSGICLTIQNFSIPGHSYEMH
jgi:HEAT repeat protein